MYQINNFELGILDFIQSHMSCTFLDKVMPVITSLADAGIFWIIIAVVMLFFKKTRKMGITMGVALLMGVIVGNCILKPIIDRTRPYDFYYEITGLEFNLLIDRLHDGSFPSGHTLASFEAAGAMLLRDKRFGIPALVLAIVIAFSRLYLYVHYPSDVLAGIILGLAFAFAAYLIINAVYKKFGFDGANSAVQK